MTYATLDDLNERAGEDEVRQIADRDGDGQADPDVIEAALQGASNVVDSYVSTKYTLPFVEAPPVLTTWATSLTRYTLHRHGAPEHVETDFKTAMQALRDVAKGVATLPVPSDNPTGPEIGTHASYSPEEVFTEQNLRGWK